MPMPDAVQPELKVLVSLGYTPDGNTAAAWRRGWTGSYKNRFELAEPKAAVAKALGR